MLLKKVKEENKVSYIKNSVYGPRFVKDADDKVRKVKVKTDIQDINNIEITEGLKECDMVITGPYDVVSKTLKAKDKVRVVDKKDLFDKK